MTTESSSQRTTSTALVEAVRGAGVRDERVIEAFRKIARRRFVPVDAVDRADTDEPISIGHGQVTTQPSLVARMVEALELSGEERVLEIGTGLGYQAAILGTLSREVYSMERLGDLAARARDNLRAAGLDNVVVIVGDGTLGLPGHAPYDAIVVAAAAPAVPSALVEQLIDGGRLVQPMGGGGNEIVTKFRKRGVGLAWEAKVVDARFVPLVAGPVAELPEPDFNLLVSTHPFAPGRARREIADRLGKVTGAAPEAIAHLSRGIFAVKVALDPREALRRLRALCESRPRAFRYTLKWVPVDRWARAELPAMKDVVVQLRQKIGPNETWRMTVERRTATTGLDPSWLIRSLAELIDAKVDLGHPDKVVLTQLFEGWVAFSIVAPNEVFSVGGACMKKDEFLARVKTAGGLPSVKEAERWSRAVLTALADLAPDSETRRHFIAELPAFLKTALLAEPPRALVMDHDAFVQHIGVALGVRASEAEQALASVWRVLRTAISAGEIAAFEARIPKDVASHLAHAV